MTKLFRLFSLGAFFVGLGLSAAQTQTVQPMPTWSQAAPSASAPMPERFGAAAQHGNQDVQTVIAQGVGKDIESAAKNAAENALIQVVGSFVQSDKILTKRSEINDGIRRESRSIDAKTREYSQGSIKSFDVLETSQNDGLFRVSARVAVRIEDFKAFVAKLAEGETSVGAGIYAQVATQAAKQANAHDIILNSIFLPYLEGRATEFVLGNPQVYSEWKRAQSGVLARETDGYASSLKITQETIVVPITVKTNNSFIENITKVLDSVASAKKKIDQTRAFRGFVCGAASENAADFRLGQNGNVAVAITGTRPFVDVWLVKESGFGDRAEAPNSLSSAIRNGTLRRDIYSEFVPDLAVTLLGSDGVIREYLIRRRNAYDRFPASSDKRVFVFGNSVQDVLHQEDPDLNPQWVNIGSDPYCITIVKESKINLFMNIEPDILAQVKSINVKLIKR
jgi:hypothetical protein